MVGTSNLGSWKSHWTWKCKNVAEILALVILMIIWTPTLHVIGDEESEEFVLVTIFLSFNMYIKWKSNICIRFRFNGVNVYIYIYIFIFIFIFIFILVQKLAGKKLYPHPNYIGVPHCQSHHGFPGLHAWDGWVLRWPGELESVHEAYWNPYCFLGYHVLWESEGALIQFQSHGHQLTFWVLVSLLDTKLKLFWDGCWRELLYTCGVDINILIQANVIYLWGRETPNKVIEGIGYRADIQIPPQPTVRLTDVNIRSTHQTFWYIGMLFHWIFWARLWLQSGWTPKYLVTRGTSKK